MLTKNRFRDEAGEQSYFHQFGIGPGGALGIGYALARLGNRAAVLEVQLHYQQLRTRVEVDGIGDDPWNTGALHLVVGTTF